MSATLFTVSTGVCLCFPELLTEVASERTVSLPSRLYFSSAAPSQPSLQLCLSDFQVAELPVSFTCQYELPSVCKLAAWLRVRHVGTSSLPDVSWCLTLGCFVQLIPLNPMFPQHKKKNNV